MEISRNAATARDLLGPRLALRSASQAAPNCATAHGARVVNRAGRAWRRPGA
jgi:hypothetical protein